VVAHEAAVQIDLVKSDHVIRNISIYGIKNRIQIYLDIYYLK
jgi:hypothetical protein